MLAVNGGLTGALLGLLIGIALSVVCRPARLRQAASGVRTRAEYRLSLFVVPVILAVIGGAIGAAIT